MLRVTCAGWLQLQKLGYQLQKLEMLLEYHRWSILIVVKINLWVFCFYLIEYYLITSASSYHRDKRNPRLQFILTDFTWINLKLRNEKQFILIFKVFGCWGTLQNAIRQLIILCNNFLLKETGSHTIIFWLHHSLN